jgi:hypothetical protein
MLANSLNNALNPASFHLIPHPPLNATLSILFSKADKMKTHSSLRTYMMQLTFSFPSTIIPY